MSESASRCGPGPVRPPGPGRYPSCSRGIGQENSRRLGIDSGAFQTCGPQGRFAVRPSPDSVRRPGPGRPGHVAAPACLPRPGGGGSRVSTGPAAGAAPTGGAATMYKDPSQTDPPKSPACHGGPAAAASRKGLVTRRPTPDAYARPGALRPAAAASRYGPATHWQWTRKEPHCQWQGADGPLRVPPGRAGPGPARQMPRSPGPPSTASHTPSRAPGPPSLANLKTSRPARGGPSPGGQAGPDFSESAAAGRPAAGVRDSETAIGIVGHPRRPDSDTEAPRLGYRGATTRIPSGREGGMA